MASGLGNVYSLMNKTIQDNLDLLDNLEKQFGVIESALLKAKSEGKKTLAIKHDKATEMFEQGEDDYKKTHSNCCDDLITAVGVCVNCGDHAVSQYEAGE